MQPGAVKE